MQGRIVIKSIQKLFWIYLTNNFIITRPSDLDLETFPKDWRAIPITHENYFRVREFRDQSLDAEYRHKLSHGEKGYFAESDGQMVGSIWATTNLGSKPVIVRTYMNLSPKEALIHDVFTGEQNRGRGVARFLLYEMVQVLLSRSEVEKIIVDVNFRNIRSLKMMEKCGLRRSELVLCVSILGRPVLRSVIRQGC